MPGIHRTLNLAQRSFLFGTDDADTATTRLIATAASATGFMKGEPGRAQAGWYQPGADNSAVLGALRDQLALAYPAAGPALWAVRLWTNLLWQLAYLSVIAVHLQGAVPDFGGLSQARSGIYIDRYRLVAAPMWSGPTEAMIERADSSHAPGGQRGGEIAPAASATPPGRSHARTDAMAGPEAA
jgi:hypothetical protein